MTFFENTQTVRLNNGIKIYMLPIAGSAVELQCVVKTGSIHEAENMGCGLSHFLEHMLFQGCEGYPGTSAADNLDKVGAKINAYTTFDHTCYHVRLASNYLSRGIDILGSMVSSATFPQKRFELERDVILRECDIYEDNVEHQLFERSMYSLFQQNPVRHRIIGYRSMIEEVNREMMCKYYESRYTPERIFWVITGAFSPNEAVELIEKKMGHLKQKNLFESQLPIDSRQMVFKREEFIFPDPICRLMLSFKIPEISHQDMPALDILSGLIGMGEGSILVKNLERGNELALGVRSYCYALVGGGISVVAAECLESKQAKLENAIYKELDAIRKGNFSAKDVKHEKIQQYTMHLNQLRDIGAIATNIVSSELACNCPNLSDSYLEIMNKTTYDNIIYAAEKYLNKETFTVVKQLNKPQKIKSQNSLKKVYSPKFQTVKSGIKTLFLNDKTLPLVDFELIIPAGSIFESKENAGISQLIAETLLTGCAKFNSEEKIISKFDSYGASVNVSPGANSFAIKLSAPSKSFELAFKLLCEIITTPNFDEGVIERERTNFIMTLKAKEEKVMFAGGKKMRSMLFGEHPYSWASSGLEESLKSISRNEILEFYNSSFCPSQMALGFCGDLSEEKMFSLAEYLDNILIKSQVNRVLPNYSQNITENLFAKIEVNKEQSIIIIGAKIPPLTGKTQLVFDMLRQNCNHLSSNLLKRIREDNALSYNAGMSIMGGFHPGIMQFFAITTNSQVEKCSELLKEEIKRLGETGMTKEEFLSAQESSAFSAALLIDNTSMLLQSVLLEQYYNNEHYSSFDLVEEIRKFEYNDVNNQIKQLFKDIKTAEVVVLGDKTKK